MNSRTRLNRFEVAIWILGIALLVAGVAGALWASRVMNGGFSCIGDDCSAPVDYALAQSLYVMIPPLVTAGLVAVVASLAVRAVLTGIARRAAVDYAREAKPGETQPGETQPGETQPGETQAGETQAGETQAIRAPGPTVRVDPAVFAPPQFRPRERAVDHSAFKRPSAD